MHRATLRGFADLELPIGLMINDIPILIGKNGPWTSLPSKPQIGQDRRKKSDVNGKAQYTPVLSWRDRDLFDPFSTAVVELIRAAHPGHSARGVDRERAAAAWQGAAISSCPSPPSGRCAKVLRPHP
jgi:hypothetical protein